MTLTFISHNFTLTLVKTPSFISHLARSPICGINSWSPISVVMASFPVTLLNQPRQQFRLFYHAVVAAYGAACTTVYQHCLLEFIVNDIQWEQLPDNVVLNDDLNLPNQIVPRPTIIIPPTPAANATALTIKVWERRLADNVSVTDNLQALKTHLIASVQPADIVLLHDPFFGLLNVPALAIMTHLTELHGTLNRSDFTHLRLQVSLPMMPNESTQDFIGAHQEPHEQFAATNLYPN